MKIEAVKNIKRAKSIELEMANDIPQHFDITTLEKCFKKEYETRCFYSTSPYLFKENIKVNLKLCWTLNFTVKKIIPNEIDEGESMCNAFGQLDLSENSLVNASMGAINQENADEICNQQLDNLSATRLASRSFSNQLTPCRTPQSLFNSSEPLQTSTPKHDFHTSTSQSSILTTPKSDISISDANNSSSKKRKKKKKSSISKSLLKNSCNLSKLSYDQDDYFVIDENCEVIIKRPSCLTTSIVPSMDKGDFYFKDETYRTLFNLLKNKMDLPSK